MNYSRIVLLVGVLAALAACQQKSNSSAQLPEDKSPTVATVNGRPITETFLNQYIKTVTGGKDINSLTTEQRDTALDNIIRGEVVADEATKENVDKQPDVATLLELTRVNVLQQTISDRYLKDRKPTEQELRAEYETQVAHLPKLEYHAKHILVATEPYAQKIVERLQKGEKFEDLAKKESMDSSKDSGGDLGWFTPDHMVKPFADAILAMKPGQYTLTPIHTQYGWHVIELVETRDLQPPPFEQVQQRLEQVVQAKKFRAYEDELLKAAKVDKKLDVKTGTTPAASDNTSDKKGS